MQGILRGPPLGVPSAQGARGPYVMNIGSSLLNISAITVGIVLVPLLWLFLFVFLWEDRAYAQSIGFERWTFWLLTAAVVLSLYAETTLFPFDGDYLAINIGGAVIPLVLSAVLFAYFAPPRSRSLPIFLGIFGAEAAAAFAVVVLVPSPVVQTLGVVAVAALATVGAVALPSSVGPTKEVAALVGLSSGVLVLTFAVSSTIPGVGIEVNFPQYLVGPVAAGAVAAILGSYLYGSETGRAVPLAYAATTFGVIVGADLLRQPPLYASSLKGLYVIGGGNYSDLVYLSPLLALAVAYLFLRYTEATHVPASDGAPFDPTSPYGALAEGIRASFSGTAEASLASSREASHAAADQARLLLRIPPPATGRPWEGLPVPSWVAADQANLDSVAQHGPFEPVEAERGAQTARALVGLAHRLARFRFATTVRRAVAYAIDLAVVLVPAILVWYAIMVRAPSVTDVLTTAGGSGYLLLLTASYGFIAFAFLYFVLLASIAGTSVGKRVCGIEVRDRAGRKPGFLRAAVRESPKLIGLSAIGIFAPIGLALALGASVTVAGLPSVVAGAILELVLLAIIAFAVGVSALVAVVAIALSSERQRIGDAWAGTWVLTRRIAPVPPTPAPASSVAPAGPAAPAEGATSASTGS